MEVRDGFIVGIFNYCDRWCARCAFTSRCSLFADVAAMEAAHDPALTSLVEAPPLPEDVMQPPQEVQELIDQLNELCRIPISPDEWERIRPRVPPEHQPITARARGYALRTYHWLAAAGSESACGGGDAREVICWFHVFIAVKVNRALTVWPGEDSDDSAFDRDGSAKIALLAIERSHAAWLDLVERGVVTSTLADPFIADLVWLGEALECACPRARAFVRSGFDEPEAVARLLASERGPP